MFKKPPTLKPSTPLRSSSRRAFVAHLQALYPVLESASAEIIQKVIPNGLKLCNAITSANQKTVIYTDENGRPLWFELGATAGEALQQAQKKGGDKNGKQVQTKLAEVFPTIYVLWIVPHLLPRLPTWPQIVDPTLLSGSALIIPGLIPSPNTYPEVQQTNVYPGSSSIIAITAFPSSVPMVVARLELDMKEVCSKRAAGEKGKAATTIHCKGDYLWEMGGKKSPPNEEEIQMAEKQLVQINVDDELAAVDHNLETMTINGEEKMVNPSAESRTKETEQNTTAEDNNILFSVSEVDDILHLALLQSLAKIAKQINSLPMPISSLYSSQILPNRPAHWPPRDGKGRGKSRLSSHLVEIEHDGEERLINPESINIKRTSAKKLAKLFKSAEKNDLLKCKDVKGKDTLITSINSSHTDFLGLAPYYTIAQLQQESANTSKIDAPTSSASTSTNVKQTTIVIEKFWKASASSVKLFQEMRASTSEPLSQPIIRGFIYDYISLKNLIDSRNQSQIRLEDPILVHALYPKAQLSEIPASLTRQEVIDRLLATSCVEYHRSSRLQIDRANLLLQKNSKGKTGKGNDDIQDNLKPESDTEFIGQITKGPAKPVTIEIKIRQGRKAVTLITGLEVYGMDPNSLAHDLMKLGASASATALPTSTSKNPKHEVFVQGDQRKAVYDYIEGHGLDRRFVTLVDGTKK